MQHNIYVGACRLTQSNADFTNCLFVGRNAGENHRTPANGIFIIGDDVDGADGQQDFIIAPVPSITEDSVLANAFLQGYGTIVYVLDTYYNHLDGDKRSQAYAALRDINTKCAQLVFERRYASGESSSNASSASSASDTVPYPSPDV